VIAAFLYLRIIVSMYMADAPEDEAPPKPLPVPFSAAVGLGLTLAFTVVVGFLPSVVVEFSRNAVSTLNL
jgi:NADH:ubiquinone oxidoreductase subunit 2 (subunit N)